MMQTVTSLPSRPFSFARLLKATSLLLALAAPAGSAWATDYTVTNPVKFSTFTLVTGDVLTIDSNVDFRGTITVRGNNVVINNNGEIHVDATLTVSSGMSGTVINNQGTVPTQKVYLNASTTINNGSDGNTAGVTWTGYVGSNFTVAPIINNFASWTAQMQPLPGGTIANKKGATWNAYMTVSAPLTVTNDGTWSSQVQPAGSGAPTFTFTNSGTWSGTVTANGFTTAVTNSGNWSSQIDYSGSLTINNSGTWTGLPNGNSGALRITNDANWNKGFNFPNTGPNSFVNTGTAIFNTALGMGSATTITNGGTMTMSNGMGNISANSSLNNQRGATLRVVGQLVNFGTVSNAGTVATTGNFRNESGATMTGPAAPLRGSFTTDGYSVNAGTFGMTGRLDFCDAGNRTGFDAQTGTVGTGTTYCSLAPLPVELTRFSAQAGKGKVQLQWATATERNSASFVVERSATNEGFTAVAEIKAQGNSAQATVYAALDAKPLSGTSYYRLRQVDLDGAVTYSKVATVRVEATNQPIDLYPNPATDRLTLDLSATAAPCEVRLTNLTGQAVLTTMLAGGQAQELPLTGVPAGLYLLHVRTAAGSTVQRIEKK